MAHNLEISDGQGSIVLAERAAWHGLGTVLDKAFTSKIAMQMSRQNWHVSLRQAEVKLGNGTYADIPGFFMTVRDDTHKPLGIVSDRYKVCQNEDAFSFLDSLVENGELLYESAGVLGGGEQVWILARMPSIDYITEEDTSLRYILFSHGHDGKTPIHAIPTATRVVCANTLAVATDGLEGIRHTGDLQGKLDFARKYLSQFDVAFTLFRDNARLLATRKYQGADVAEYIKKLFPITEEMAGRGATLMANKIQNVRNAWSLQRNNLPSIKGTWWQVLNAVTDAIDHDNRKKLDTAERREKQFVNLLQGNAAAFKTIALNLALEMSA